MKKGVVIALVLTLIVIGTVCAKQQTIWWRVRWGHEDYPGSFWTYWQAWAEPDLTVRKSVYYRYSPPTGSEITLTENTLGITYMGNPSHMSVVDGFYLSIPGENYAFAGTFWDGYACLPGPTVTIEKNPEFRVTVKNSTGIDLYVTVNQRQFDHLPPGETWHRAVPQKEGPIHIMTGPILDSQKCADVRWHAEGLP